VIVEVASFHIKKTAAEKAYVSALCRVLVLLHFRSSEQWAIKLMRRLLNHVAESVSAEKDLVKELKRMADRLKAVDRQPEQELLQDQADPILGKNFYFLCRSAREQQFFIDVVQHMAPVTFGSGKLFQKFPVTKYENEKPYWINDHHLTTTCFI
jgi:hypothetical protein